MAHGQRGDQGGEQADEGDQAEGDEHVGPLDDDGIGVGDERVGFDTEGEPTEALLAVAQCQSQGDTQHSAHQRDEPSLDDKDARDLLVGGSQVSQGADALVLLDDEQRERADDIERGDEQDKRHEQERHPFLDIDQAVGRRLLVGRLSRNVVCGAILLPNHCKCAQPAFLLSCSFYCLLR